MTDIVVIGAGIVGLATTYQLLQLNPNLKIVVLEKECKAALHQSSRNSGVIHSGVYYKPNSLKAINCMEGKKQLTDFAKKYDIESKKLGKVIVASSDWQINFLKELYQRGKTNKIKRIELIDADKLKAIEPHVFAKKAIWIPDVEVIKFKDVARKLVTLIEQYDCKVLFRQKALKIISNNNEVIIETSKKTYKSKWVVNCAGLFSDRFIKSNKKYRIIPFRGEYYEVVTKKKELINGLVYPVKDPRFPFLGVHLTKTIDGRLEVGPNAVLAFAREGYKKRNVSFTDLKDIVTYAGFWKMTGKYWKVGLYELYRSLFKKAFVNDLKSMMPCIESKDLKRASSGVRAQVVLSDGSLPDDFIFENYNNVLHVVNAPSPAATAAFSIGMKIAKKVLNSE